MYEKSQNLHYDDFQLIVLQLKLVSSKSSAQQASMFHHLLETLATTHTCTIIATFESDALMIQLLNFIFYLFALCLLGCRFFFFLLFPFFLVLIALREQRERERNIKR